MSTKPFKQICMHPICDQKVFTVWKDERDVRDTPCPKCGNRSAILRVPEPAISSDEEDIEKEEDNMLKNLEELQNA